MLGTNSNKNRCAVLLPSGTRFERLFDEVLELAVIETGLIPTRLQQNAEFPTPINVFIDEIEKAGVLLADVSENTPEIWLAVGCAIAIGNPLCLISSKSDLGVPASIQHLPLIPYPDEAFPSDYIQLQQNITAQLFAIMPRIDLFEIAIPEPVPDTPSLSSVPAPNPSDDLVSYEVLALKIIDRKATETGLSPRALGLEMQASESGHLTSHAMNALKRRGFIERKSVHIREKNELYSSDNIFLTREGEDWLVRHGKRATSHHFDATSRDLFLNDR
jgi:hypothetical protein